MKRLLIFSTAAFVVSICTVGFTAKIKNTGTIKIENNSAHFAVNNCHIGKFYEQVHLYAEVVIRGRFEEAISDTSGIPFELTASCEG